LLVEFGGRDALEPAAAAFLKDAPAYRQQPGCGRRLAGERHEHRLVGARPVQQHEDATVLFGRLAQPVGECQVAPQGGYRRVFRHRIALSALPAVCRLENDLF